MEASPIDEIFFTCPSGKQPRENDKKEESPSKEMEGFERTLSL